MAEIVLFKVAMRDLVRPKKLAAAVFLGVLPAVIAIIWRASAPRGAFKADATWNLLSTDLVFGFVLVLLAVVFGTGVLSQELEQKTIVYLLTRPTARWRILLVRFLAAVLVIAAAVCLASALLDLCTYGLAQFTKAHLARECGVLALGTLAYSSLFLFVSTFLRRPLLYGLLFVFGWESWVPSLPGSFQKVSLMAYLHALAPHARLEADSVDITKMATDMAGPAAISHALAWEVLGTVIAVCLTGAVLIFSVGQYVPRDDAEG